jgi:hypothetical protein
LSITVAYRTIISGKEREREKSVHPLPPGIKIGAQHQPVLYFMVEFATYLLMTEMASVLLPVSDW